MNSALEYLAALKVDVPVVVRPEGVLRPCLVADTFHEDGAGPTVDRADSDNGVFVLPSLRVGRGGCGRRGGC